MGTSRQGRVPGGWCRRRGRGASRSCPRHPAQSQRQPPPGVPGTPWRCRGAQQGATWASAAGSGSSSRVAPTPGAQATAWAACVPHPATTTAAAAAAALDAGDMDCSHLAARVACIREAESPAQGMRRGCGRRELDLLSLGMRAQLCCWVKSSGLKGAIPVIQATWQPEEGHRQLGQAGTRERGVASAGGADRRRLVGRHWMCDHPPGVLRPDSLVVELGRSQLAVSRGVCQGARGGAGQEGGAVGLQANWPKARAAEQGLAMAGPAMQQVGLD